MTEDEKKFERLRQQLSVAKPYEKRGIQRMIEIREAVIQNIKIVGDRIVANATEKAANLQVQAILDSTYLVLETMNGAAELMSSETRKLSLAIEEADKSSSLVGRALAVVGSAAWFMLAWDIAKTETSDGYWRLGIMGFTIFLVAGALIW